MMSTIAKSLLLVVAMSPFAAKGEFVSDLASSGDEGQALEVKAEEFWQGIFQATDESGLEKHVALYSDVEGEIAKLPAENDFVREALRDSLAKLRHADELVLAQTLESSQVASSKLSAPLGGAESSFLFGGQNFLKQALRAFTGTGHYSDRLQEHINQRQADILPLLRGAASSTGSVLSDCREASKRAFDVQKYDIYNQGVPPTPEGAKAVAERLVEAVAQTRGRFTKLVTEMANGISRDVQRKHEDPARTVTRASLAKAADSPALRAIRVGEQLIDV